MSGSTVGTAEVGPIVDLPREQVLPPIVENLARERAHEFLFVALPIKIAGTTGSMIDPIAIV